MKILINSLSKNPEIPILKCVILDINSKKFYPKNKMINKKSKALFFFVKFFKPKNINIS